MKTTQQLIGMGLCCALMLSVAPVLAVDTTKASASESEVDTAVTPKVKKSKTKAKRKQEGVWKFKLDEVRASAGAFMDDPAPSSAAYLFASASASMQSGPWEFALGARMDGQAQGGSPDFSQVKLDYGENYVRWRGDDRRLTVGTQNVLWGRVDEISPIDRMSRVDLTRLILDKQPERRRAVPAVRLEQFMGDFKLDAVWVPVFDAAVVPHANSAWYPIDLSGRRILGIGTSPVPLVGFQVRDDEHGSGGGGVRLTRTGASIDYGLSLQRVRNSLPYYQLGAGVLTGVHPFTWVTGAELETQMAGATWRMELARSSDVPVTNLLGQLGHESAWDLVLGTEFFPGDAETRVTLQLAGHKTNGNTPILDRDEIYAVTGDVEHPFAQGRWRFNFRFASGLNEHDVYLNPKLTYLGVDQHEFFVAGHMFSGAEKTLGGFYEHKDFIELGWRGKF